MGDKPKYKKNDTDFKKVLSELQERVITDYDMEKLTGLDRSKFTKLRAGARKTASYDDGCLIMKIHEG